MTPAHRAGFVLMCTLAVSGCHRWSHLLVTQDYTAPASPPPSGPARIDVDACFPASEPKVLLDLWLPRSDTPPAPPPPGEDSIRMWRSAWLTFDCEPQSDDLVHVTLQQLPGRPGWRDTPPTFHCDHTAPPLEIRVNDVRCAPLPGPPSVP